MPSRDKTKLERRRDAAQATLDKFRDLPFSFEDGRDCGKMSAFHLRQLGIRIPLSKLGSYKTPLAAKRAMKKAFGVDNMAALADKYFEPISPAMAIVGDLIEVPGDGPLGTLAVALGNGMVITYHEDAVGAITGRVIEATKAWRTLPL